MKGDDIHLTFGQNQLSGACVFSEIQRVNSVAFFIDRSIFGVDIFGLAVIKHPSAEGNHVSSQVHNGEHNPVAESVVNSACFSGPFREIRMNQFLLGKAERFQMVG